MTRGRSARQERSPCHCGITNNHFISTLYLHSFIMAGDSPQKVDSIPFGGKCRDDYLSYTCKQQKFFVGHISLLLILVGIGIFLLFCVQIDNSSSFINIDSILMTPFLLISTGLFIDLVMIIFGNCEEYYRLDKNGLYFEYKKLLWRTRKTIPLDTIQNFVFNSRVINNDKGPRTVHYFVHVVTQKKTVSFLEMMESKKAIPEWFAFAANTVLANLTGRDPETSIVSDVSSSAAVDKPSKVSKVPIESKPQDKTRSNSSSFKPLDNAFLIPPGCKLREDYLSYVKNDLWRFSILYAILFALLAISSIGYWMGFVAIRSISVKDFYSFRLAIIPVYIGCLIAFIYYCFRIKETGSLDIDGFHYKKQSLFSRSTKDIPLNSIQEFRSGIETNNTKENSNIAKFVEIVVPDDSIRILTENDDSFREWVVDSGNAVLANLKSKARELEIANAPPDDYIGVDEFKDILNRDIDS